MRRSSLFLLSAFATLFSLTPTASAQTRLWGVDGTTISLTGMVQQGTDMVPDNAGGTFLVWTDTGGFSTPFAAINSSKNNSDCGAGGCTNANVYATHLNSAGAIAAGWPTANNGVILITDRSDLSGLFVQPDAAGGFVVAWTTSSAGGNNGQGFAQRYNSSGTAAWTTGAGDGTSAHTAAVLPGGGTQGNGIVVSAGANRVFYLVISNSTGVGVAAVALTDGSSQTLSGSTGLVTSNPDAGGLVASPDATDPGAVLYVQAKYSGGLYDIKAWRFNATGLDTGWPLAVTNNGSAVDTSNGGSSNIIPAGDGTNAVYVYWYGTSGTQGIYAAKLSGTTSPTVDQVNGHLISTTLNNAAPNINNGSGNNYTAVGAGGEFALVWSTNSNSGNPGDVYLQIVNPASGWAEVLGSGGADLGQSGGSNFEVGASTLSTTFWAAWTPNYNGFNAPQEVFQAFSSTGAMIFASISSVTVHGPSSDSQQSPAAIVGVGNGVALAFQDQTCSGGNNCTANLFTQLLSTAAPPVNAPSSVVESVSDAYDVQVQWSDHNNTPPAGNYLVQAALDSNFQSIAEEEVVTESGSQPYSFTLGGLTPNTQYWTRVQGQNGGVVSSFTNASNNPEGTGAGLSYTNAGIGNWSNLSTLIYDKATDSGVGCAMSGQQLNNNGNCNEATAFLPAPNGDVFVVWTQDDGSGAAYNVMAQRFAAGNGAVVSSFNGGNALVIAAHVPEAAGGNGGSAGSLAAALDGSGGFAVTFGSGTANELGMAADVNINGSGAASVASWGPKTFSPTGSQGYGEKNVTVSGGVVFSVVADNAGFVYVQGVNLNSGALISSANSGSGVLLSGASATSKEFIFSGAASPANGTFSSAGAIFSYGLAGPGNSLSAIRVNVSGGTDFSGTLSALTNVYDNGTPLQTIPDGSGGMYAIWIDTVHTHVDALHMPAAGPGGTISTATVAGGWNTPGSITYEQPEYNLQAILTQAGPVAAWDAPTTSPSNQSVNAALLNTGGGVTVWSQLIDKPVTGQSGSSTTLEGVAIATNPAGNVEVTYTYGGGAEGSGTGENLAELNPANGAALVSPTSVLSNLPDTVTNGGGMPFAVPSGSGFIVGELSAPDIFADMVSSFSALTTVEVPNGTCSTIQCAVNAVPSTLTSNYVISVAGGTYPEQVTIQSINTGPFTLTLESTGTVAANVVAPASSNAAFNVYNANVKLEGFSIIPAHSQTYGISISSSNVTVDHVNLQDAGGDISALGVSLNGPSGSNATISNSTVSVAAANVDALFGSNSSNDSITNSLIAATGGGDAAYFDGGNQEYIAQSSFTSVDAADGALNFYEVNGSTITASAIQDLGPGACSSGSGNGSGLVFDASNGSVLSFSTVTTNGANYPGAAVYLPDGSSSNAMMDDYIQEGYQSDTVYITTGSNNSLTNSSLYGNSTFECGDAVLEIAGNSNSVSGSYFNDPDTLTPGDGDGIFFDVGASFNRVQTSTVTVFESDSGAGAVYLQGGNVGNALSNLYVSDIGGNAAVNFDQSSAIDSGNSVSSSTIVEAGNTHTAVVISGATGTSLSGLNISQPSGGDGVDMANGDASTTLQFSTVTTNGAPNAAVYMTLGASDAIAWSRISDTGGGNGVFFSNGSLASISNSTITTNNANSGAIFWAGETNSAVTSCYAADAGSGYGMYITGGSQSAITGSGFASQAYSGVGLTNTSGYSFTGDIMSAGTGQSGLQLLIGNTGLSLTSNTVTGASIGVQFQDAVPNIAVSTLTFQSLTAGATALQFANTNSDNPVWDSTFTYVNFADAVGNREANVDASQILAGNWLQMLNSVGPIGGPVNGPLHKDDPNGIVNFLTLVVPPVPTALTGTVLGSSSITWTWSESGSAVITSFNFYPGGNGAPVSLSSSTFSYTVVNLAVNASTSASVTALDTTLESGKTTLSTATFANPPVSLMVTGDGNSNIMVSWGPNGNPGNTNYDAQIWQAGGSTTTVQTTGNSENFTGLTSATTYFMQVFATNVNGVPTSAVAASTETLIPPPSAITNLALSNSGSAAFPTVNLTWTELTALGAGSSYAIEFATASNATWSPNLAQVFISTSGVPASASQSASISFLRPNTNYFFTLWANRGTGFSNNSNQPSIVTLAQAPVAGQFTNGQNAALVLGAANFISGGSEGVDVKMDGAGNLWVLSGGSVLEYQPPFTTNKSSTLALTGLSDPKALAIDAAGDIWVGDIGLGKVVEFVPPFSNAQAPTLKIGLPANATGGYEPEAIAFDATGDLWIGDVGGDSRVLELQPPFSDSMNASLVLGQPNFTTGGVNLTQSGFAVPHGLSFDGAGDLWVEDAGYNRVLEFQPPFTTNMPAVRVLGQANFTTSIPATTQSGFSFGNHGGVIADASGNIWVGDASNSRVLEFQPPFASGMNASSVLGQANFTTSGENLTQTGLGRPEKPLVDAAGNLWVPDHDYQRVLEFQPAGSFTPAASSIFVAWSANGDPAGTSFTVQLSTASNFSSPSSQVTTGTSATFSSLTPATTYYFQAKAANSNSIASGFNSLGDEDTTPTAPTGVTGTGLGTSSITWTWNAVNTASSYNVYQASNSATLLATVSTTSFVETGLSTNSAAGLQIAAVNIAGAGSLSAAVTSYSLALPPTNLTVTGATFNTLTLQWGTNQNPAGTTYEAQAWLAGGSTQTLTLTANTTTFSSLQNTSTYFMQVFALNGSSVPTAAISTSSDTLEPPPSAISTLAAADSAAAFPTVKLTWTTTAILPTGSAFAIEYSTSSSITPSAAAAQVYVSTSGLALGTTVSAQVSFLLPNRTYSFWVFSNAGTGWSTASNRGSVLTLANSAAPNTFTTDQNEALVLGQPDFTSGLNNLTTQSGLFSPRTGVFDAQGNLWVADYSNSRVVEFQPPFSDTMNAALVLGQPNFTSQTRVTTQSGMSYSHGVAFDAAGNLWVVEKANNRVTEFQPPFTTGMNASLVLGQASFTAHAAAASQTGLTTPHDIAVDAAGNLWVADTYNNRVLEFSPPFTNDMTAALVLGQPDFTSSGHSATQNGFYRPQAPTFDASGNLWIADYFNDRALKFTPPFTNGMNASLVLGQADFTSTASTTTQHNFATADGFAFDGSGNLWLVDSQNDQVSPQFSNNRILLFQPPFSNGMNASLVLGEPDFSTSNSYANPTQNNLDSPHGISFDSMGHMWVSDLYNNRVVEFTPTGNFNVGLTSVTVGFGANFNPAGTPYTVQIAANPGFSPVLATVGPTTSLSAAFTGLSNSTTYYFQAKAANGGSVATAYDSLGSVITLASPPGVSTAPFTMVGYSSFTYNWTAGSNSGNIEYEADLSTNASFSPVTSSITYNTEAFFGGSGFLSPTPNLLVNTVYYARVKVYNNGGGAQSAYAAAASTSTLAVDPFNATINGVTATTILTSWAPGFIEGANPAGTRYLVVASTGSSPGAVRLPNDVAVSTVDLYGSGNVSLTINGVMSNTTYYLAVQAVNNNNVGTAFINTNPASTTTLASPPTGLAGAGVGISSITWTWNPVAGASSYNLYLNNNAPVSVPTTSYTDSTLAAPNTAEPAQVSAVTVTGQSGLSPAVTGYSLAAGPLNLQPSAVFVTSITFTWSQNSNAAGTNYRIGYVPVVGGANTNVAAGTGSSYLLTGLNGGTTYTFTISAINGANIAAVGASTNVVTNGVPSIVTPIGPAGGSIVFQPPSGPISLSIPPGAFPSAVTVTLEEPLTALPAPNSPLFELVGTGIAVQIMVSPEAQPQLGVPMTMTYDVAALNGHDPKTLFIARYDPTDGVWVPLVSTVDTANDTVTAVTNHFSLFQLMYNTAATSLNAPKVFPNPFRPAKGETSITFANLPAFTSIKIYTILGEKVRTLSADASGMATWDAKNENGNGVASGVYFVLAGSGSSRTTFKVAIQR